jgi:DNA-binding CsgD family transcriptional regulator
MMTFRPAPPFLPPNMSWREICQAAEIDTTGVPGLTAAEQVVLLQLAQGLTNREIGERLGKSEFTVKNQVSTILRKLGLRTRGRLIALFARQMPAASR